MTEQPPSDEPGRPADVEPAQLNGAGPAHPDGPGPVPPGGSAAVPPDSSEDVRDSSESVRPESSEAVSAEGAGTGQVHGEAAEAGLPSLRAGIEAILLVIDEPVAEVTLAQILERPRGEVAATLRELAAEYTEQGRGFELREIAGGWRYYTRDTCAPVVERFVTEGQQTRLTQAALETLAVVAYRQPVSRARVSAIRGVNSDGVFRTLTLRGLIEEAGQDPETQAHLYRTTRYFLERLGLRDLDELPDLAPYLPEDVEDIEEAHP